MERLKREGVKTHKERVEELNKYLSRLSEHHDMYVFSFFYALARHGLTCAAIGRRLDPVKWSSGDFFFVIYVRTYSVVHCFLFKDFFVIDSSSNFSNS